MSRVLVVGAGAVGAPIAAWLVEGGHAVTVLARGERADAIEREGIRWFAVDAANVKKTAKVRVVRSLEGLDAPELVVIGVKSTALAHVSEELRAAFGPDTPVVALQNGIEVLRTLPRILPRACIAIVHFNAWPEDGRFVVAHRGALVLAGVGNATAADVDHAEGILRSATTVVRTTRARDAVLGKMVLNLTGSLQALTAFHRITPDDPDALQQLLGTMLVEGLAILRAVGAREVKVSGIPPWLVLEANARLPRALTGPLFRRNLRKMRVASFAQDLDRGVALEDTELDAIHGELVRLAEAFDVRVPLLRLVLTELRARFMAPPGEPMGVRELADAASLAGAL